MTTQCAREHFTASEKPGRLVKKLWMRAIGCGKRWKTWKELPLPAPTAVPEECSAPGMPLRTAPVSSRFHWITPSNFQQQAVRAVNEAGRGEEHEGAVSFDHLDSMLSAQTLRVVQDCIEANIRRVWIYRAGGQGAVSPEAIARGKVLADRSLSRLLGSDWPRTLDELEALKRK
jgi:hypothetical protein